MNKQIYVNIAGATICMILGFLLAMSIFMFSRALADIRENKQTNKQILSILQNKTCELPH
jgi:ammonia channel protein AmtB